RKQPAEEDPFDAITGTLGLTGGVSTMLVLQRVRGKKNAVLHVAGRDVEDQEKGVEFEPQTCSWTIIGEADEVRLTNERAAIHKVIEAAGQSMTPAEVAAALDKADDAGRNSVKQRMWQMS